MAWVRLGSHSGTPLSNNLRDVGQYARDYSVDFMCTEDLLCLAVESGRITQDQGCQIWHNMKRVGRVLPNYEFAESLRRYRKGQLT